MMVEDRVVTTDFLVEVNRSPECDDLQLGPAVLDGLEPDAFHVIIPVGHTHGLTETKIVCQAQLAVGSDGPLRKEVLLSQETYDSLPTAFSVLNAVRELVPMTVDQVDGELDALFTSEDQVGADLERDEESARIDARGDGHLDGGPDGPRGG
jgi:hypothetical protein